jgi:hypothetical protein
MASSTGPIRFDHLPDLMAGHDLSVDQEDYLDLLSDLVAWYEESRARQPSQ